MIPYDALGGAGTHRSQKCVLLQAYSIFFIRAFNEVVSVTQLRQICNGIPYCHKGFSRPRTMGRHWEWPPLAEIVR
ncbi:hypothetical protein D3C87_1740910 [compost metagenome]